MIYSLVLPVTELKNTNCITDSLTHMQSAGKQEALRSFVKYALRPAPLSSSNFFFFLPTSLSCSFFVNLRNHIGHSKLVPCADSASQNVLGTVTFTSGGGDLILVSVYLVCVSYVVT